MFRGDEDEDHYGYNGAEENDLMNGALHKARRSKKANDDRYSHTFDQDFMDLDHHSIHRERHQEEEHEGYHRDH